MDDVPEHKNHSNDVLSQIFHDFWVLAPTKEAIWDSTAPLANTPLQINVNFHCCQRAISHKNYSGRAYGNFYKTLVIKDVLWRRCDGRLSKDGLWGSGLLGRIADPRSLLMGQKRHAVFLPLHLCWGDPGGHTSTTVAGFKKLRALADIWHLGPGEVVASWESSHERHDDRFSLPAFPLHTDIPFGERKFWKRSNLQVIAQGSRIQVCPSLPVGHAWGALWPSGCDRAIRWQNTAECQGRLWIRCFTKNYFDQGWCQHGLCIRWV